MDKPKVTPKDFFLWIGAMIALYASVFSLISLLFDYINIAFPDVLNAYVDPYSGSIRYEIASLMVLAPTLLILMRMIRNDIARLPEKRDLWIRRWALFLTVFVAGATVLCDLITLINYFLGGEITTHFVLKVFVVFLVAGASFLHFLADIWGYWILFPQRARMVGWGAGLVVVCTIAAGFFIMGSPNQIRTYRLDDERVSNLQEMQSQVVNFWQLKEKLPTVISDLNDPISNYTTPLDPVTRKPYTYSTTGSLSFKLCATFGAESQANSAYQYRSVPVAVPGVGVTGKDLENDTWQHGAGEVCFTRTIDPQRYPPYSKQKTL